MPGLQDWEQVNATWESPQGNAGSSLVNGVTPDSVEASAKADAIVTEPGKAGKVQIPLNKETIQSWANGSLVNYGWSIITDDPSLWSFNSSEAFLIGTFKPELTILYTDPVDTDKGTFSFSVDNYTVNENAASATVTVNRIGGSDGSALVNWGVSDGTGTSADITGASAGSIAFADGELFKTFNVAINNDILLERNETLNVALSGAGITFDRSTATLTIRDNDFVPTSGNLLLNEIFINSPGNDPPHEFVELSGLAGMGMGSLYYVAIEGLVGPNEGAFEKVVDLGAYFNGSNGLSLLTPQEPGFAYNANPATTQIQDLGTVAVENVSSNNDSTTYMLIYSPSRELTKFAFDYDWDNDGSLDLPVGATPVDTLGVRTLGQQDQVYGPTASILSFTSAEVDAISRKRSDSDRNDGTAWFGGNLLSAGDDYLLYEAAQSTALPVTGAAMTPGDVNTGSDAQSPLVSLISVTPNLPVGTITVTFNGLVSQVLSGDGATVGPTGSGFTITDGAGQIIPTIDLRPVVTGIGTSTLTLSFTGSAVNGGLLPAGNYRLNVVGNGLVGNGRAVDAANSNSAGGSDFSFSFTQPAAPVLPGDYNGNGVVDAADYVVFRKNQGSSNALPNDAIGGLIGQPHYDQWRAHFGQSLVPAAASSTSLIAAAAMPATTVDVALATASLESKDVQPESDRRDSRFTLDLPRAVVGRPAARRAAARALTHAAVRDDALVAWLASHNRFQRGADVREFQADTAAATQPKTAGDGRVCEQVDMVFAGLGGEV